MTEFAYINWLRQKTPKAHRVTVGPGDDAAVLDWSTGRPCLVTTDVLMDGKDFVVGEVELRRIGRKAMAVNLSDIAAMAGKPIAAVVGVVLPRNGGREIGEGIYAGLREMADLFDTALAGGDTNTWDGPLVISVTILGEATDRGAVTRAGAKPGDWLMVTGPLGGSILGHHLDFIPRVTESLRLHERVEIHAMIDISDGLSADVHHLCTESACGAVLEAEAIPIAVDAKRINDGRTPLCHALEDGEDFELAFAVSANDGERLLREQPIAGIEVVRIGEFIADGFWLELNGVRHPLAAKGWVHEMT